MSTHRITTRKRRAAAAGESRRDSRSSRIRGWTTSALRDVVYDGAVFVWPNRATGRRRDPGSDAYRDSVTIRLLQVLALLPGISRSGVTMVGALWRGLDHEDAARFAFLLATPVIFAAGVLKLPSRSAPPATTSTAR